MLKKIVGKYTFKKLGTHNRLKKHKTTKVPGVVGQRNQTRKLTRSLGD